MTDPGGQGSWAETKGDTSSTREGEGKEAALRLNHGIQRETSKVML